MQDINNCIIKRYQVGILAGTCISNTMINDETLEKIILDNLSTVTLENDKIVGVGKG